MARSGKLNDTQVREILERLNNGEEAEFIAVRYGVTHGLVSGIKYNRYHKHISRLDYPNASKKKAFRSPRAKLKDYQVREILELLCEKKKNRMEIADMYGVNAEIVNNIKTGKTYKHIDREDYPGLPRFREHPQYEEADLVGGKPEALLEKLRQHREKIPRRLIQRRQRLCLIN